MIIRNRSRFRASIIPALAIATAGLLTPALCFAEGPDEDATLPGAPRLLPTDTMAYIRLDNAEDLREDLKNSSVGQMVNDPQMRPFADEIYATARELFDMISSEVGVNLDELLSIPHGQVALAIHPAKPLEGDDRAELNLEDADESEAARRKNQLRLREDYSFGGTLIVDAGKNIDRLMAIIDKLEERIVNSGQRRRIKEVEGTEVTRLLPGRAGRPPLEFFERDGTLVIGVGHRAAQDVLDHWMGTSDEPTLADNANFGTIMSRCVGAEDTRPQITFFADPHAIIDRIVNRTGNIVAGLVWTTIEDKLGASRIGGIGGSSFRGGEIFEGISHNHIKIDPPRDGVLGVLRPETGDTAPPKWVPDTISGYTTIHWDIEQSYENIGKVIDEFQGPESLKRFVETPTEKRLGLKIKEDFFENTTGRLVRVTWMQKPARINSSVTVVGVELTDPLKAKAAISTVRDRMPNRLKVDSISGHVVYRMGGPGDRFPENLRRPEPSLMILDKWLIYSDSTQFLEKAALAQAGNLPRLLNMPEYDLVASELGGKLDGEQPFFLSFFHGSDGIKLFYDLAKDETARSTLRRWGENNPVAQKLAEMLERNELPPFSEFEKYFAPTGVFGYDEPDGLHFGFYTLRADE